MNPHAKSESDAHPHYADQTSWIALRSLRANRGHDVIYVHVAREPPFAGQGIVDDPRLILDAQPGIA